MSTSPVTYVPTDVLLSRLERSVDIDDYAVCMCMDPSRCEHSADNWEQLWFVKFSECSEEFKAAVTFDFNVPVCVSLNWRNENDESVWTMGNGHHRVSIARYYGLQSVPVVFAFDGDYMHSETTEDAEHPANYGDFENSGTGWDD